VPEQSALYHFANRHGRDPRTGLILDVVDRAGAVRDGSARVWPQTEAIKAHLIMGEGAGLARTIRNLLDCFIAGSPAGTWTEHLAPDGTRKSDRIPSSSLYHVILAFSELERIFGSTTSWPERA
jgi:N-acylglucosamine 2-epimerase/mannose-6-phosphate isomerase